VLLLYLAQDYKTAARSSRHPTLSLQALQLEPLAAAGSPPQDQAQLALLLLPLLPLLLLLGMCWTQLLRGRG
jgi:hypothetical protein